MSLVWTVMYGLEMLSDAGLGPAIIRHKRGDSPDFLNTAWTIQVIRGVVLLVISCLIAIPIASIYGEPDLVQLIPAVGLGTLITGFTSTSVYSLRRHMTFEKITILEFSNEVIGLFFSVCFALLYPSVWALVAAMIISRLIYVFATHILLSGIRNHFRWEKLSVRELTNFGKWIYLGSAFHFVSVQGDRLLLAYYLSMSQLGVYSVAIMLSEAVHTLVLNINRGVLFPAYGRTVQNSDVNLRAVSYKARLGIDIFFVLPIAILLIIGDWVVVALYDARYHEAGWMLQVLCVCLLMAATNSNSECCLVALGHTRYAFAQSVGRAGWILVGIPIGWALAGIKGVVWAVALSEVPVMAVLWFGLVRHRIFSISCECRSLLFSWR